MYGEVNWNYEGRRVIVTGGSRGIGRKLTEAFLAAGAKVAICGRSAPEDMPKVGENSAHFYSCDVRDAEACRAFIDQVAEDFGGIDLLINNAGGAPYSDAATASPRFSDRIIALNLMAPIYLSQAAHRHLKAAKGGGIINIASIAALRPAPGTSVYAAAKSGLLGLTRSLAQEWGPDIRVNAIIVGMIGTEQAAETYGSEAARDEIAASIPLKRLGSGTDIAKAALFLGSDAAEFVSGAALEVHGGGDWPLFLDIIRRNPAQ